MTTVGETTDALALGDDLSWHSMQVATSVTEPSATLVPRWWTAFAAGWLLVLVITIGQLAREPLSPARHVLTLVDLTVLAAVYLWLTLAIAPTSGPRETGRKTGIVERCVAIAAMAVLVVPLVYLVPEGGMWWHIMYAVVAAGLALPPVAAACVIAALVVAAMLAAWFLAGIADLRLLILLAIGAGAIAVRLLALLVQQLRDARGELARRAADEERLRIARDLHDLLGHSLSLIVLESQLVGRIVRRSPVDAERKVAEIERAAREALQQVRSVVAGYRQPTLQGELSAARELLDASGVRTVVDDAVGPLPPNAERLLAWTIREAVTNVIRHSRARECVIRTHRDGDCAWVTIVDDGLGPSDSHAVAGSGLAGLAERAQAEAGRLTMGPGPSGGFSIALAVPIDGSAQGGTAE